VDDNEPDTSAESADYVGDEVFGRSALLKALFEVGYGADIGFDRGRSGLRSHRRHGEIDAGEGSVIPSSQGNLFAEFPSAMERVDPAKSGAIS